MATFDVEDTIAAIASPPGPGLRGILRISGPQTIDCVERLFRPDDGRSMARYRSAAAIDGRLIIDSGIELPGMLLFWPTARSYTRQPTAEFHTIGSTPLLQLALAEICGSGARLAKPGEFTLRAFLSGRIDLTQAEAVLAVIDSASQQQLNTALQQLAGGLAGPLDTIRNELLSVLAELEAGLDFVEEDIEFITAEELTNHLEASLEQLEAVAGQISHRDLISDSVKVVLVGEPNSGKSSLFNALVESNQAIVTEIAGTTTDFISAKLSLHSGSIELIDTAGFENATGQVMGQAQAHRADQQQQANVRLLCIDATRPPSQWEQDQLERSDASTIVVLTKSDLLDRDVLSDPAPTDRLRGMGEDCPTVFTSCVDSMGLDQLRNEIAFQVLDSRQSEHSVVTSTVLRAAESLRSATDSMRQALTAAQLRLGEEIVAAEIRQALDGLGQVVGVVYTDDILDLVFGRFCIGK